MAIVIGILSSGWLIPLYLGYTWNIRGFEGLLREDELVNSFPYFQQARQVIRIGTLWGFSAVGGWAAVWAFRFMGVRK